MENTFFNRLAVILVIVFGFCLRIAQVGQYSFWFDETGVAMAASSSTIWHAVEIAREHSAAMPLDYIVAWAMARFSLDEGWLRLPSVVWGTLSIATAYLLFRRLFQNKPVQLVAALLVATSPLLIQYSQELRFYSAGLFFYLLSTILLLRALDFNRPLDWLACLAALVVGFYFQVYTVFALINGLVWVSQFGWQRLFTSTRFRNCAITIFSLLILALPGFLMFGMETKQGYELFLLGALNSLLTGLGWLPVFGWEQYGIVYTLLCFLFSLTAIVVIFRSRDRIFIGLLLGILIQIVFVITADMVTGYFFAPRQFIILLPFSYLLAARGVGIVWQRATPLIGRPSIRMNSDDIRWVNRVFAGCSLILMLVFNSLALNDFYAYPKSYTYEMSQVLAKVWQPGNRIRTVPWYEPLAYRFYLENRMQNHLLSSSFESTSMAEIGDPPEQSGRVYVTCRFPLLEGEQQVLVAAGFQPMPSGLFGGSQLLWYKDF